MVACQAGNDSPQNPRILRHMLASSVTVPPRECTHSSPPPLNHLLSPRVQHRSVLLVQHGAPAPKSQFNVRRAESDIFGQVRNAQQIQHLKAFITGELAACRQSLIADQQVSMRNMMASLEGRLEAEIRQRNDLVKQIGDVEGYVRFSEKCFSNTCLRLESRLDSLASQQTFKYAEYHRSRNETLARFEHFAECMSALSQEWRSMELRLASFLPVTQHSGSAEQQPKNTSGQKHGVPKSVLSAAPASAGRHVPQSEEPEFGEIQRTRADIATSYGMLPEESMRVKALEVVMMSMQQQEQERIRCWQQHICERQTAGNIPEFESK